MIDDIVEGSIGLVLRFFLYLVFDVVMISTGELVIWAATLGRRKPRWDFYTSEKSPSLFVVFSEASCWVGIATWLGILVLAHSL
jgi:hypothetical protein